MVEETRRARGTLHTSPAADEGTVLVLGATVVETGEDIYIGVDHRPGSAIVRLLDFEQPIVEIEEWQIIGKPPVPSELTQLRYADRVPRQ